MNKDTKMQKLPIAMAAVLAFLAIGAVQKAKARPLDNGGRHGGHHHHHKHYGKYGWYGYAYHPYKYYPRPLSSYSRFR
jgi:hypothetical protein